MPEKKSNHCAALSGVKVVDLGCYIAGPLVGMLLTDQGAETIKVEPLSGPLFDHRVNAVLNRGKKHCPIDLKLTEGRKRLMDLVKHADILIENYSPNVMNRLGLSPASLRKINPGLIIVSIKGFSVADHAFKNIKAYEGIIAAATGQYTDIHAIRKAFGLDPVYTALPIASVYAAVHAATAAVLALRERAQGKSPALIESTLVDAALSAMSSMYMKIDNQANRYDAPRLPNILNKVVLPVIRKWSNKSSASRQDKLLDLARKSYPAMMTSYKCRDGKLLYVFAIDNAKLSITLLKTLGLYEKTLTEGLIIKDPYKSGDLRNNLAETSNLSRRLQNRLKSLLAERFAQEDAKKWEITLSGKGLTCAVVGTTQEWLNNADLQESGIVTFIDDPILGSTVQPGLQTFLSQTPTENITPKARIFNDKSLAAQWEKCSCVNQQAVADNLTLSSPSLWLAGITVIELCSMVAGPVSGRTLAEYGAKVIKIETPRPNHGPRLTCWYGIDVNQGKSSILLDLKTEKGRDAFNQILASGDILLSNISKNAEKALGLSTQSMHKINEELIIARLKGFNGPLPSSLSQRSAYDPVLQAMSGIMMRYGDEKNPELHAIASCVDALTGYSHAFGVALALYKKQSSNTVSHVDTCLATAATLVQLPYAFTYKGRAWQEPNGQHSKGEHALYRIYATRDSWIFIAANSSKVSELPSGIMTHAGPSNDHEITKKLIESFKSMSTIEALKLLQSANIAALEIEQIDTLRKKWLISTEQSTEHSKLKTQHIEGLGKVSTLVANQVMVNGQKLNLLAASEKAGGSTQRLLKQFGIDADHLIAEGIAATELSSSYLP